MENENYLSKCLAERNSFSLGRDFLAPPYAFLQHSECLIITIDKKNQVYQQNRRATWMVTSSRRTLRNCV